MEEETTPLLPKELRETFPQLYATEHDENPLVRAKLFTPWANWTWFVTEFDGQDRCFGLVSGHEVERQGETWWDKTVTSGTHHRDQAAALLGMTPYAPHRASPNRSNRDVRNAHSAVQGIEPLASVERSEAEGAARTRALQAKAQTERIGSAKRVFGRPVRNER